MKKTTKRWLAVGLAAAVLAAVAWTATAQSQEKQAPPEKPKSETRSLRREMARDLFNITPEQDKKLQELREARLKEAQAFRGEMAKIRGEMRDLLKDPQANAAKIDQLIDSRARLQAEREKSALRTRAEWQKVFTPEQLEKMKKYRSLFQERFRAGAGWRGAHGRPWMHRGWRMRSAGRAWRLPYSSSIWW